MSHQDPQRLQRLLAVEFERRGWEYNLAVGRAIVEEIGRTGSVDPFALSRIVDRTFLAVSGASRDDIAIAVAAAFEGVTGEVESAISHSPLARMKLLFVAAGPADEVRLRLDAEHREIRSRLRSSTAWDQVIVETALAARPTDLVDELNRTQPTILHLSGHGGPTGIALEDPTGNAAELTTEQLIRLVRSSNPELRLVVLNTCESARQAQPITNHVDAAIGMTRAIGDDAARAFSGQLYSSLAEGVPLGRAFEQAKLQISLAGFDEDETPSLFLRVDVSPADLIFVE